METNTLTLLFYPEIETSHSFFLSNRYGIFTQETLLKKSGFHFWISILDVELYGDKILGL